MERGRLRRVVLKPQLPRLLQDEVEDARAALYLEQARKLRLENDAAEAAAFHTRLSK